MRKFKRGDMRNKWPNIRVLQGRIYTRAKMGVYAGLVNYVVYASTKCAFYENGSSCMIAMKITLLEIVNMAAAVKWLVLVYLLFNVCYCSSPSA